MVGCCEVRKLELRGWNGRRIVDGTLTYGHHSFTDGRYTLRPRLVKKDVHFVFGPFGAGSPLSVSPFTQLPLYTASPPLESSASPLELPCALPWTPKPLRPVNVLVGRLKRGVGIWSGWMLKSDIPLAEAPSSSVATTPQSPQSTPSPYDAPLCAGR